MLTNNVMAKVLTFPFRSAKYWHIDTVHDYCCMLEAEELKQEVDSLLNAGKNDVVCNKLQNDR